MFRNLSRALPESNLCKAIVIQDSIFETTIGDGVPELNISFKKVSFVNCNHFGASF